MAKYIPDNLSFAEQDLVRRIDAYNTVLLRFPGTTGQETAALHAAATHARSDLERALRAYEKPLLDSSAGLSYLKIIVKQGRRNELTFESLATQFPEIYAGVNRIVKTVDVSTNGRAASTTNGHPVEAPANAAPSAPAARKAANIKTPATSLAETLFGDRVPPPPPAAEAEITRGAEAAAEQLSRAEESVIELRPKLEQTVVNAAEKSGGKNKLLIGGIVAAVVAIGAFITLKKKSPVEKENERRAEATTPQAPGIA